MCNKFTTVISKHHAKFILKKRHIEHIEADDSEIFYAVCNELIGSVNGICLRKGDSCLPHDL